jgi:hypothetical protein
MIKLLKWKESFKFHGKQENENVVMKRKLQEMEVIKAIAESPTKHDNQREAIVIADSNNLIYSLGIAKEDHVGSSRYELNYSKNDRILVNRKYIDSNSGIVFEGTTRSDYLFKTSGWFDQKNFEFFHVVFNNMDLEWYKNMQAYNSLVLILFVFQISIKLF